MYTKNTTLLKNFHKLYKRVRTYFYVPKFLRRNATKPLVNLELPPLSHLYFIRTKCHGGFHDVSRAACSLMHSTRAFPSEPHV